MLDVIEDVRNEFKIKLTDKFEEEVISFLNTNGGNIYIGVNDKGDIVGINGNIDLLQRTIKDRIKDNIMPSTLGLYDVIVSEKYNKKYIKFRTRSFIWYIRYGLSTKKIWKHRKFYGIRW